MAGSAAARVVETGLGRFTFSLASREDDVAIRRLLRGNAFGESISLSLEREPDAFAAATIDGDIHQTLVARDRASGEIVAVAARSVRDVFLNGAPARVGYLGQLRIDRGCHNFRGLLDEGFAFCRTLHHAGDARLYLTSIVAENNVARRLLVKRRFTTAPRFVEADRLVTLAIPVCRPSTLVEIPGVRIYRGSRVFIDEIVACLQRNLRRYQFAPCWTADDLLSPDRTRGLALEDFLVAIHDSGVAGCLALWDQRAFKQVVVRGYGPSLARWRPLVNLAARWTGAPQLPHAGRTLQFAYLSHAAVDEDRPDVLTALIAAACRHAHEAGLDYVLTAFAVRNPLCEAVASRFRHREFASVLYVAYWSDGDDFAHSLDGRIFQPEVAVL
jgi:hypothetical protein